MLTTLLMFLVTQMIPQQKLDFLSLTEQIIKTLSADDIDDLLLRKERFWI